MRAASRSTWTSPLPALAIYAALVALAAALGLRMTLPRHHFQLLSETHLTERLGESLLYLHAQPPLPNALLGAALAAGRATGRPPEDFLLALHLALGAATVACFALLARGLLDGAWKRWAALGFLLLNPAFYHFLFEYSYAFHELFYLSLMALLALRCFGRPSARRYGLLCLAAVGLVYTRALFHYAWAIALLAACGAGALRSPRAPAGLGRAVALSLAAALLALAVWPAKNLAVFGFFGYSSWRGHNLSTQLPVERPFVHHMYFPGDRPAMRLARERAASQVPPGLRQVPVLADPLKAPGVPNWNHYSMLAYSRLMQERSLALLARRPELMLQKAARNYLGHFCRSSLRNPWERWALPERGPLLTGWMRAYEWLTLQASFGPPERGGPTGFALLFPAIVLAAAVQIGRRRSREPVRCASAALLLYCVLWVLALVLLVDGVEGNRMRFSTEPFLALLALWTLPARSGARSATATPRDEAPRDAAG